MLSIAKSSSSVPTRRRDAICPHVNDGVERGTGQRGVGKRAARQGEQVVDHPGVRGTDGDELLGQHVDGPGRHLQPVETPASNRAHERGALDQFVPSRREQPALGRVWVVDGAHVVARPSHEVVEPDQRQGQVRSPLVVHDRVDFVDDNRAGPRQDGATPFCREEDIQRLGRRHQDVWWSSQHAGALSGHGLEFSQWGVEIAPDMVTQRLEGRYVDDIDLVRQLAGQASRDKTVYTAMRNVASVLPEPVGADTRTSSPAAMRGQASSCAGVAAPNRP